MKTNILILAAGSPVFEAGAEGYPLCLSEYDGMSLLERIVFNTRNIHNAHYVFALRDKDAERFHLENVVRLLVGDAEVIRIPEQTRGSACTAILSAAHLNSVEPVLVVSANELVDLDLADIIADFNKNELDGGVLTFRSVHPRYSYVQVDNAGLVTEVAHQNPISHFATTGVFWFARSCEFVEAVKETIRKNSSVKGNFFVALAYNELILKQKKIGTWPIDISDYKPLKSERQLQQYEFGKAQ